MNPRRLLAWFFVVATLVVAAVGTINVIRLRIRGDAVGTQIQRHERAALETRKELDGLKRKRDQGLDTLQLIQRVGDDFKPPAVERVLWVRPYPAAPATVPLLTQSPRTAALDIAFRPVAEQGGKSPR
ncbi:MAG: hypothetical protein RL250_576 [Verrucomicrobiota bacterium]|jgi:hypothetical protein